MSEAAAGYVLGHNERERRRLALQGSILQPFTQQLLRRAGIAAGMHVLDLGCGIGDVSIIAARLVGRNGRVTAIDIDEGSLSTARERAREQGLTNLSFIQCGVGEYRPEQPFDAVTGRHILIHTPDPLRVIASAWRNLSQGGVAVFQEFDFSIVPPAYPSWPLREQLFRLFREFFSRATQGDVGGRLFHLFGEAGFATPDCRIEAPVDGGPESPFYEWIAEVVWSIRPAAERLGMTEGMDWDVDTLAQRLRDEAVALRTCCPAPLMVGAFARKH